MSTTKRASVSVEAADTRGEKYEAIATEQRSLGIIYRTEHGWTTSDGIHFRRMSDAAHYLARLAGIDLPPPPVHSRPSRRKPIPPAESKSVPASRAGAESVSNPSTPPNPVPVTVPPRRGHILRRTIRTS